MPSPARSVKVALVQDSGVMSDLEAALDKVERCTLAAAERGADLVVFPEAFIGGYPKGIDFGIRLGSRSDAGRKIYARYVDGTIGLESSASRRLGDIVRAAGVHLVIGVIERLGGTLYCASWTYDPGGKRIAIHRKLMPTALERCIWGQGDGSTMQIPHTTIGRIGTAICWENYMPLYRSALYQQGVEIYCAPTVDDRDQWQHSMHHIALEGRCFVLACCQFLRRKDLPEDLQTIQGDDPDTVMIRGGSCVISPLGRVLAEPLYGEAGLVEATLSLQELDEGHLDMDVAGHYSRPDIFRLEVDAEERLRAGRLIETS